MSEDMKEEVETTENTEQTEEVSEEELLKKRVEELEEESALLKDQMLRHQADLENYRKRLVKEKEEAVTFANVKLLSDLLEFLDNLERAISVAKTGSDIKALTEGVEMIQNQLLSTLDKNWGLKQIETKGKEFNPEEHEACMMTVDSSLEVETVLDEFQKGYKLHDRIIRPAKVRVGKPE